ncbi:MAG: MarR family transcriptional regulator [Actinomycetota bacterium]|nr:MarR family transcriptional regulator [Actinomycetota bacterium]
MKRERAEECAKRLDDFMTELFHNLKGGEKEFAAHAGLTVPQLFVLKMVESKKGCKMGDLAKALHLHFGTATSIVDRLIRDGLLSRKRDDDDRRVVSGSI